MAEKIHARKRKKRQSSDEVVPQMDVKHTVSSSPIGQKEKEPCTKVAVDDVFAKMTANGTSQI
jgi:hypothetical protein